MIINHHFFALINDPSAINYHYFAFLSSERMASSEKFYPSAQKQAKRYDQKRFFTTMGCVSSTTTTAATSATVLRRSSLPPTNVQVNEYLKTVSIKEAANQG